MRYHHDSCKHGAGHQHGQGGHGHGGHHGGGAGFGHAKHMFKHGFGPGAHIHAAFGAGFGPGGMRARRGDIRAAVLRLLTEQPMHGYQIIQELSARSEGAWSPSPGSVYPTLQLLADEGLVTSEEAGGKKVFSLTEAGAAAAAEAASQPAPWEDAAVSTSGAIGLRDAVGKLMPALFQVGRTGTESQIAAAIEIVDEARKKLYALLAED